MVSTKRQFGTILWQSTQRLMDHVVCRLTCVDTWCYTLPPPPQFILVHSEISVSTGQQSHYSLLSIRCMSPLIQSYQDFEGLLLKWCPSGDAQSSALPIAGEMWAVLSVTTQRHTILSIERNSNWKYNNCSSLQGFWMSSPSLTEVW